MKLWVLFVSLTFYGLVTGDPEGVVNERCHASGEAEGGDEHTGGGGRNYSASRISIEVCWHYNVRYPIEELHGINDTSKINAVLVAACAQDLRAVNECVEGVLRRSHCQTAEERAGLRLKAIYKHTTFEVGCRNNAALVTQLHVGKKSIRSRRPEGGSDPLHVCMTHQDKDLRDPVEGVNKDMIQEYMRLKGAIGCLQQVDGEGTEEGVNSLIAILAAFLDSMICIHPTDGTEVLCKTLLVE